MAGYLLVVDLVGERARERIQLEFARSEMPAKLAVWRSDEAGLHVARIVEELCDELTRAVAGEPPPARAEAS
jgi:hypothetical protein